MSEMKPRFTTDPRAKYRTEPEKALTDAELRAIIADATHLKNKGARYVLLRRGNDGDIQSEMLMNHRDRVG